MQTLSPVKQVKIQRWIDIIRACQNSGLTNEKFCEVNGLSIKSYYYYLAKIRKMAFEEIPYKKRQNNTSSSEVVVIPEHSQNNCTFSEIKVTELNEPSAECKVTIRKGTAIIEIQEDISEQLLFKIMRAL